MKPRHVRQVPEAKPYKRDDVLRTAYLMPQDVGPLMPHPGTDASTFMLACLFFSVNFGTMWMMRA